MINFFKKNLKGLLLSIFLGLGAHFMGPYIPGVNGVILAFLIAIVLGNIITIPQSFQEGISFSGATLLEFAIIFLAFSINFQSIAALGALKFLFVLLIVVISLAATILISKRISTKNSTAWLVGFGTAICGSSAIAALAPVISKQKEDMGIAIATVNLLGSLGMIILPFTLPFFFADANQIGFILGATLQSVGNVAGAGYGLSQEIGDTALTVKLARVALLTPAIILFSFFINKGQNQNTSQKVSFKLPYYLWLFIGITIVNSIITIPTAIIEAAEFSGKLLLTISMAAIGLKVSFKTLWKSGRAAIGFGAIIFTLQIIASLALILVL